MRTTNRSLSSNRGFVVGLWGQGVGFRAEKLRQNCPCNCVLIEPSTGHFTPTAKMHKLFRIATTKEKNIYGIIALSLTLDSI